jgi:polar amino acid transport system substrate-binding protein
LSLAAVVGLTMAACGSSDDSSSTAASTQASADCTPKHKFTTIEPGKLSAVIVDYMPFGGFANNALTGVDGDTIAEIAKRECLELSGKLVDTAGAIAQVTTGRADVAGGDWWRSRERLKVADMTVPTFLDAMAVLSKDGYATFDDLKGKKVGDVQGYIWNAQAKKVLGDNYKVYQSIDQVEKDLENGRIDAAIVTVGQVGYQQKQGKYTDYKLELMKPDPRVDATNKQPQSALVFSKSNPELGKAMSEDIAEMKSDGTLAKIVKKYGLPEKVLETGPPYLL